MNDPTKDNRKYDTCPECGGDGEVYYSCCGDDVKNTLAEDYGLCPTCHEHLDGERSTCETCNGEGIIEIPPEDTFDKADRAYETHRDNQTENEMTNACYNNHTGD